MKDDFELGLSAYGYVDLFSTYMYFLTQVVLLFT